MAQREEFFRKELVEELTRAVKMMRDETSIEKKIYYLSATYGITSRTFRYSFSKEVLMADFVLQTTYNLLFDRVQHIKAGDMTIDLTREHFDKLQDALSALAKSLANKKSIEGPLQDILAIAFSTTGPGNYLREKGELKL